MTSTTSAGTKYAISAGLPATPDAAGYAALSFTTVKGVESLPAFGASTAVNNFQPLDGALDKHKGPTNYGALQIPMALDDNDDGQSLVRVAAEPGNNAVYSHCVTYPNGAKRYFPGRVFGLQETPGSATNVLMQTTTVEIIGKVVKVGAASAPATAPDAPTIGTVTAGNAQNSVPFADNADNGSAITGHKVERQASGGSFGTIAANYTGASPYVDTGLTNGTAYGYRVSAINAIGTSPASNVASGTPSSGVPAKALTFNDNAPLQFSNGSYLELAA